MTKLPRGAAPKQPTQRQRESAMWLNLAKEIERTGSVPGGAGICYAARRALEDAYEKYDTSISRSYDVVSACFGKGWPFGNYGSRRANELRVYAATLLSLIVCTDQEPEPEVNR